MEIGGYFGLEQFFGAEYHGDLIAVNNARCALLYLLKARGIKKLNIPYFLCDSVANLCEREGYDYSLYHIGEDFLPLFDGVLGSDEWLYVVNYYGQISNSQICRLKEKYTNLIVDNVQAFFQKPIPGVDTVYSCRKFFGVPDGGYVATDAVLKECLEQDYSGERMKHVLGRFEGCASDYYTDFKANDHAFMTQPLRYMSKLTHNLLRAVDYDSVRRIRNENYEMLDVALGHYNLLSLQMPDGPYAYPFYCKNGMDIKKELAKHKIYVATLWPNVLELDGTLEKDYAENILPLPCDQRYSADAMNYMIKEILACIR